MTHAKSLLEVDRSTLFLVDRQAGMLWSKVADGAPPIRVPWSKGLAGACYQNQGMINIRDAYQDARFNQEIDRKTGYRTKSVLVYPIMNVDDATRPGHVPQKSFSPWV